MLSINIFGSPTATPSTGSGCFLRSAPLTATRNPIQYSFLTGIGGKGVMPGRPDDTFGIGFARTQFSNDLVPLLRQQFNLGLQREDAVEMYYNAAITQWLNGLRTYKLLNPA